MIAVDAGFLYAIVDRHDNWHARSLAMTSTLSEGWITTWPVVAEVAHLMSKRLGASFAAALIDDVSDGNIAVWDLSRTSIRRLAPLMRKYASLPMDLADASLVLLAEYLGHGRILSTDERDFKAYRWKQRKPFANLLAP